MKEFMLHDKPQGSTDLAIIGGGPAGTAAALAARRRGLNVAIWERDRFPRDKVCGEFLSWEALPLLQQEIPQTLARAAAIRSAEFISQRNRVHAFRLPMEARGLSRWALDEALWRAAAANGAATHQGEVVRVSNAAGPPRPWQIQTADRGTFSAQTLLVACGRWWALEGFPSPARKDVTKASGPWVGAKAHFAGVAPRDAVEMYFFPGGYCGLAPVENGLYNTCCLLHRSLIERVPGARMADFAAWLRVITRHEALKARLHDATQVSTTLATAPVRPADRPGDHQGALLAGDAAGFLDPFTGDGISVALHSGQLAAEIVARSQTQGAPDPSSALAQNVQEYRRGRAAFQRSFRVATLLRVLLRAPEMVQETAAALLSNFAPQLLAGTRWRDYAG
jgi:menaquinone-9 beta-reductase